MKLTLWPCKCLTQGHGLLNQISAGANLKQKNMRKTITLLISAALLMVANARGQTVAGTFIDAVASGGNNISGLTLFGNSNVNVNWTIGQPVIDFPTKENDNHTQGFNQGFRCVWYEDTQLVWTPVYDSLNVLLGYVVTDTLTNVEHNDPAAWCVTSPVGIDESIVPGIEIFPNPVAEELTIIIPQNLNPNTTASFFDLNGRLVKQQPITSSQSTVNVQSLTPGFYLIMLNATNGKQLTTHKLIKK